MCGKDQHSRQYFEHRRGWIEDRLLFLVKAFAIDIAAYAIMSNHLHVVLRVEVETAKTRSDLDVVRQWHQVFAGTWLTKKFAEGEDIEASFMAPLQSRIAEYRRRLMDISWFMRALNEPIARLANKEDECTGRLFWVRGGGLL